MESGDINMINAILIANRGEISSRISRTCRKMGIRSIAVFSDADRHMPFVRDADEAVYIGASSPAESYLDVDKIIAAAKSSGADAIHPGYGFLSENASFAQRCAEEGIIFIGPNPEAITAMGSKSQAKALMIKHQVPTVPGYQGTDQTKKRLIKEAKAIGFPLLLKATAGGGGKGMRIVRKAADLDAAIDAASREARSAFGDDELIIEKYVESGRHIEFQIFGDQHGNCIHLLERECTIQRRYQKVVEESPSPIMTPELREQMGQAAINAALAIQYDNAGTVEFIYDDHSGAFYFLEVNTRLQVEHPVTEEITGLDLVQLQIESAQGMPLSLQQDDIQANGYAIEVRLYAEDPFNDFRPVTGLIQQLDIPDVPGLRVESAVESGSEISMYYDPMIAKLIVHDADRQSAHRKLSYVIDQMICAGTVTNQALLSDILNNQDFRKGQYNTHFISDHIKLTEPDKDLQALTDALIACTVYRWAIRDKQRGILKAMPSGWRNSFNDYQKDEFKISNETYPIRYRHHGDHFEIITPDDEEKRVALVGADVTAITIEIDGHVKSYQIIESAGSLYLHHRSVGNLKIDKVSRLPLKEVEKIAGGYEAPMPAQVIKVIVAEGDEVNLGDPLVIISSMKMESTIEAETDGTVEEVYVNDSQTIEAGHIMLKLAVKEEL